MVEAIANRTANSSAESPVSELAVQPVGLAATVAICWSQVSVLEMLRPVAYSMRSDPARVRRGQSASPPESNHKGVKRREMVVQELPARFGFIADEMEQVLPEVTRITQAMTSVSHSASMHCMMRSVCAPRQTAPNTLERGLCTWTCWQFLPVLCRTVAVG